MPPLRAWTLEAETLVDRGPAREPVVTSLAEELPPGPWRELRDFVRFDARGNVVSEHCVRVYSIEEELTVTAFAVVGSELRELTLRTFHGATYRVSREERTVLTGLQEVLEAGTLATLRRFLEADQARREEQAARLAREGDQRVASIPGSTDDPDLGPDYLKAQELLRNRVKSYGLNRDSELLTLLGRFGKLARTSGRPLPVLRLVVEACRHAAFDHDIPSTRRIRSGGLDGVDPVELGELQELLQVLHGVLLQDAEIQEQADARNNAAAFRKAADCLARARDCLGPP